MPKVTKRTARNNRSQRRNPTQSLTTLVPKFKGDPVLAITVKGIPIPFPQPTLTVSAVSSAISAAQIDNFTARFAPMWNEYRIVGVKFTFLNLGPSIASGVVVCWFEANTNNAVPVYADSTDNKGLIFPLSDTLRKHTLKYEPYDLADLNYRTTAGAQTIGYLNMYSDSTNYGLNESQTSTYPIMVANSEYMVQFRGFA